MMKIGLSTRACPGLDLRSFVQKAADLKVNAVEIDRRGPAGRVESFPVAETELRELVASSGLELLSLDLGATIDAKSPIERQQQISRIAAEIELAGRLGCPFVCIGIGRLRLFDRRDSVLTRVLEGLISLVPVAAEQGVTVLVENQGDFRGSDDLWYLVDGVGHPAIQACWNQAHAVPIRERPTVSIPRLGTKIGLMHISDVKMTGSGGSASFVPLGEGDAEIAKQIDLLRGIVYDRCLMYNAPAVGALADSNVVLPAALDFLRECVNRDHGVLSAYKGDKNAPKLAPRAPQAV